jgi:Tol biopolymer transport system component
MKGPGVLLAVSALFCVLVPSAASAAEDVATGQTIVFSSNRGGAWAIWSIKPDGSDLRQITKPSGDEQDVDPCFSPDGSAILFTSTRGGTLGLWQAARSDSTAKPQRICDGDQGEWSPDGKRLAFRRSGKLVVRDVAGGAEKTISPPDFDKCSGPAWSPDGASIAFALLGDGANAIYIVPAAGGEAKKVYDKQGACEPHWSPDGQSLVYETETHLCTIKPDGTKNRLITWFGGVQRFARFSPDGKRLVFCQAASPEGPWELYILPAAGGTPTRLTEGGSDMYPDWK